MKKYSAMGGGEFEFNPSKLDEKIAKRENFYCLYVVVYIFINESIKESYLVFKNPTCFNRWSFRLT